MPRPEEKSVDHDVSSNSVVDAAMRYRSLVETLPLEHYETFLSCCTGEALLDDVKALKILKDGKKVRQLGRIQKFVKSCEPMFAALDVFSQVDPIHFGTVWGGVRVLVQLTANFLNFYDRLTESLFTMAGTIDYFRVVQTYNVVSGSKRLAVLLDSVFAEVLDFLTGVMRIFHTSEGKAKSRARTYAGAAFKPFRFDQVVSQMKEYRTAVVAELVLLQAIRQEDLLVNNSIEEEPDSFVDALISRIRTWLAPTWYTSAYQDACELRAGSTAGWIFEQPAYQNWRALQQESSTLWIHAAALVDHEKATSPGQSPFYFFFDSLQSPASSSKSAYSAILSQILQRHSANEKLIDMFRFCMCFTTDGQPTASTREAGDLLELCLQLPELENSVLILDGLDECDDLDKEMIHSLKNITLRTSVKSIILGRSSIQGVLKNIPGLIDIEIGVFNLDDIQEYLRGELTESVGNDILPAKLDIEVTVSRLSRRADGMFLWARLMMVYLNSPGLLVSERLEAISDVDMPEGLERMYERILRQMSRAGKTSLRLAYHVFMCLMYARRPLTMRELEDSVVSRKKGGIDEPSRTIPNFSDNVLSICGGFVERHSLVVERDQPPYPSFRFIHASVKEYFRTEPQRRIDGAAVLKDSILVPLALTGNSRLAAQALEYMVYAMPKERITTSTTPSTELLVQRPLSQYATINWPQHMLATNGDQVAVQGAYMQEPMAYAEFISALCQTLSSPSAISAWIQSCFVFQHEPPVPTLLEWVDDCTRPSFPWRKHFLQIDDVVPEMKSLADYLDRVVREWGTHLWRDPSCIWEEIGAFMPSAFVINPRGITVRKPVSRKAPLLLSNEPIHKVSRLMPNGKLDYVLSVFPTKAFVESATSRATAWGNDCFGCLEYSHGWLARLEVFSIDECEEVGSLEIQLEEDEVRLQIFQTMMCSSSGGSLQFPLSMGPDGSHFAILGTLYHIHGELSSLSYTASKIPTKVPHANRNFYEVPTKGPWMPDPRSLFLYWIYFDESMRYLSLVEQRPQNRILASVFEFRSGGESVRYVAKSGVSLPKPHDVYYPGRDRREFELAFHPFMPLLALAGTFDTFIWEFTPSRSREGFFKLTSGLTDDHGRVEFVSFSSDGMSCITKRRGGLPSVVSIGNRVAASKQLNDGSISRGRNPNRTLSLREASSFTVSPDSSVTVRSGSQALSVQGKSAGDVILNNSKGEVSLSRWSGERQNPESLTLTRIPNLPGSTDIVPGVVLPSSSGDPVKIVLDKGPTTANQINKPQLHTPYPTIVERHISSIQRSHHAQSMGLPNRAPFLAITGSDGPEEDVVSSSSDRDQSNEDDASCRSTADSLSLQIPALEVSAENPPAPVLPIPMFTSSPIASIPGHAVYRHTVGTVHSHGPILENAKSHEKQEKKKRGWSLKKLFKRTQKS
ncbi:hypothetical protein DL98DRAFT_423446 [Cadophora sp. DSE1049]|nr:hypothetical protein DL98DRAFT_423446 [Cadophora sp. DSE1049]